MKKLITLQDFDQFIKMQLYAITIVSLSWSLMVPIIIKLQGVLWTASIISGYLIIQKLSVFIYPYFKNWLLKQSYKYLIILDVFYMLSLPLYFYDPLIFIYVEAGLVVIYGLIMNVFGINYDAFLMNKYSTNIFKDIQYVERIYMASAGIVGYLIVIVIELFTEKLDTIILIFFVMLGFNLVIQIYNYKKYWVELKE